MIFQAIAFAVNAHAGQYRKGTRVPYIVHPLAVARILLELNCAETIAVAAVLHDVIEDTSTTLEQVRAQFGDEVARLVQAMSEPDRSDTWENRKRHTLEFLESAPQDVLLIECADKLDNIRAIRADLARDGDSVWQRFNRGREQQRWYYHGLTRVFSERLTTEPGVSLAREFQSEVEAVFNS